jgi:hypothetical protein
MRQVVLFASAVLLCGCAASGVKVSEEQAQAFKVGTSTYSEVIGQLGEPTSNTTSSDGTRAISYNYTSIRSQPQNFIPYVGGLVAGYDNQSSSVSFTFDKRGVLAGMTSSQSGQGTGTNLAAGSNAALRPYQGVRN